MIINFRYHIFTITAIFAALGLGILIGTSIIGNDGLIDEQRHIINNITKDFDYLKKENNELTEGLSDLREKLTYRAKIEKKIFTILLKDYMKQDELFLIYKNLDNTKVNEIKEYFRVMGTKTNLLDYKKLGENAFSTIQNDFNTVNKLISWNIDSNTLDKYIEGINLKNKDFIEYNKGDVLGLIYSIVTYIEKNRKSDKVITPQDHHSSSKLSEKIE